MASWTRRGVAGALVACLLAALASTTPAHASLTERRVLAAVNDYRAAHGVRQVRSSRSLARSAGRYALHILRVNEAHHHRRPWISARFATAGENIAWERGSARDARGVVARWAASGAHRRVLLDARFAWGGVGREYGKLRGRRSTVWVLHLGRK